MIAYPEFGKYMKQVVLGGRDQDGIHISLEDTDVQGVLELSFANGNLRSETQRNSFDKISINKQYTVQTCSAVR
jgi:hypothetical protein